MKLQHKKLVLQQLDSTLKRFQPLKAINPPERGWLRAIRTALGMNGKQFAKRLGVSAPRVTYLEQDEIAGSATIKMMQQAARALNCKFVYGIVPQKSLFDIIKKQAIDVAKNRIARTSHTMLLEKQELTINDQKKILKNMIVDITETLPKSLWD
ncbi:MAG: mobile mystery protein A [Candidatus Tantalella remota]|nr:mobile mystery protein A [Candidatus Tantalella remota]